MWSASRNDDKVPYFSVDIGMAFGMETYATLYDQKSFVVRFVLVLRGPALLGRWYCSAQPMRLSVTRFVRIGGIRTSSMVWL